ncbi:Ubiquitin carboxyl-terminal hydrolase 20 [Linum grandiflorum]
MAGSSSSAGKSIYSLFESLDAHDSLGIFVPAEENARIIEAARRSGVGPTGVGAGIWNHGNACYINAILQCLTHTAPLVIALRDYFHMLPCPVAGDSNGVCVLEALHDHIARSLACSGLEIVPGYFYDNISCILFLWLLYASLRCGRCGYESHECNKDDPFTDLSLDIIENGGTLDDALRSFTKWEGTETKSRCDRCKQLVFMKKQLLLDWSSPVTIFHLKRFRDDGNKLHNVVQFPLELNLRPYSRYVQGNRVDLRYHLYGIVEHGGMKLNYGRHRCYIRSAPGQWHQFNDRKVTRHIEQVILSTTQKSAYVLFYAKERTPWFSSLMTQLKVVPCLVTSIMSQPESVLPSCNAGLPIAAEEPQDDESLDDDDSMLRRIPSDLFQ